MKRLIFYSILILVFLATCKPNEPDEFYDTPAGVPADQNMAGVTVYLDDNGHSLSRAMNKELALMGCDYFEVVFLYAGTAVSAQWRIGERAMIKGVYRDNTGINYGNVSASPVSGQGSAILLAGKSDRTLMAVGKLPNPTNITLDTKSVTFEVAAIKTGVSETFSESSFLTAANDTTDTRPSGYPNKYSYVDASNTETVWEDIEHLYFLAFKLNKVTSPLEIKAEYTFQLDYSGTNTAGHLSTYVTNGGLRVASAGIVEKKHPSYTTKEGFNVNVNALIILDNKTIVTMENNQSPNANFDPVVKFSFNTNDTAVGSIFALVFEIPVYALGETDYKWYIRQGYGVLKYELDEGVGGIGGAVLIKTGEVKAPTISTDYKIEIKKSPRKWRYRGVGLQAPGESLDAIATAAGFSGTEEYDRVFRISNLKVELQYADGSKKGEPVDDYQNPTSPPTTIVDSNGVITNNELIFIIGKERVIPYEKSPGNCYVLPDEFYGLVEVTVRFTDWQSGVSSEDSFFILASGQYSGGGNNSTSDFDYADRRPMDNGTCIVSIPSNPGGNPDDWTAANAFRPAIQNNVINQLKIITLTGSFNMTEAAFEVKDDDLGQSVLTMIVALNDNVILGRMASSNVGATILIRGNRAGLASYYFGTWPFAGLPRSPASLENTKPFSINAAGSATTSFPYSYTNKMMVDGNSAGSSGGLYNVILDERLYGPVTNQKKGVDVHYKNILH